MLPLLILGACGDGGRSPWKQDASRQPAAAEAGYLTAPRVLAARTGRSGVALAGAAAPGSRVRLGTPTGEALFATTDGRGVWTVIAPPATSLRLFGLSMTIGDRSVQSEGYLALTPEGRVAQLRAGAGAQVLSPPSRRPIMLALDVDRDGAAVISGVGTIDSDVGLRVDRTAVGGSTVDRKGRYSFALNRPLTSGPHAFEISGEGGEDVIITDIVHPVALDRPFRVQRLVRAWRVDWMTPGGGVQATLLFDPAGPAA
ncbi:MAG: hypothetical protein Q8L66_16610 [Caulobacter sp.]|nr:hypothetical protein [Caulobacter sp.]